MTTITMIRFRLVMEQPGGVSLPATAAIESEPDATVDRLGDGRWQIPGTSLAGALRGRLGEVGVPEPSVRQWFGEVEGETSSASQVWVLPAVVDDATVAVVRLGSTAIDRFRGAADEHTLRTEEVLPAETTFTARLRWDDAEDADLKALLAAVIGWRPRLGRGAGRGRGRCRVTDLRVGSLDLSTRDGLALYLRSGGPDLVDGVATGHPEGVAAVEEPSCWSVDVPLRLRGPLRTGGSFGPEPGAEGRQWQTTHREGGRPVVPGTSWKGVLRGRAELILRSLGGEACGAEGPSGRCGRCWCCEVFGYGGGDDESVAHVGRRARLLIDSTVVDDAVSGRRTHIAVDRFTGGVANWSDESTHTSSGGLFTVETVEGGRMRLRLTLVEASTALTAQVAAVLRLILQDLDDGLVGVGAAVTRGYGWVHVEDGWWAESGLPSLDEARTTVAGLVGSGAKGSGGGR